MCGSKTPLKSNPGDMDYLSRFSSFERDSTGTGLGGGESSDCQKNG